MNVVKIQSDLKLAALIIIFLQQIHSVLMAFDPRLSPTLKPVQVVFRNNISQNWTPTPLTDSMLHSWSSAATPAHHKESTHTHTHTQTGTSVSAALVPRSSDVPVVSPSVLHHPSNQREEQRPAAVSQTQKAERYNRSMSSSRLWAASSLFLCLRLFFLSLCSGSFSLSHIPPLSISLSLSSLTDSHSLPPCTSPSHLMNY